MREEELEIAIKVVIVGNGGEYLHIYLISSSLHRHQRNQM